MTHELKTWDEFMMDIATGKKSFEVRKNDRNYQDGDDLYLKGFDQHSQVFTAKRIQAKVTYVLHGAQFGIEEGYCVMAIKVLNYNF